MRYGDASTAVMNDWKAILASSPLAKGTKLSTGKVVSGTRRLENATTIVEEFLAADQPLSLALAAVVNANAESALDNTAMGDFTDGVYRSVGLFQINDLGGKRKLSGDRTDPVFATRWIIEEMKAHEDDTTQTEYTTKRPVSAESLRSAMARGASVAELTGLFGFHVERPANLEAKRIDREEMARKLFPTVADLPGPEVDAMAGKAPSVSSSWASWSPLSALESWLEVPTGNATFKIGDGGSYTLVSANGTSYGPGDVPPGSYKLHFKGKALQRTNGAPVQVNVESGKVYEASRYMVRQVG